MGASDVRAPFLVDIYTCECIQGEGGKEQIEIIGCIVITSHSPHCLLDPLILDIRFTT